MNPLEILFALFQKGASAVVEAGFEKFAAEYNIETLNNNVKKILDGVNQIKAELELVNQSLKHCCPN